MLHFPPLNFRVEKNFLAWNEIVFGIIDFFYNLIIKLILEICKDNTLSLGVINTTSYLGILTLFFQIIFQISL